MALSVNVTVSMSMEMLQEIDEQAEKHGMSRAAYVRHLVNQADDSPFPSPQSLTDGTSENEGAA